MNIYLHELYTYRKSLIIWNVVIVAVLISFIAIFPTMYNDIDRYKEFLSAYPQDTLAAMGLNIDAMSDILGFYSFVFLYIALCGAIQAANLGISLVSKEVRARTADFLITKPCQRHAILNAKIMASLTVFIITNAILFLSSWACIEALKKQSYDFKTFALMSISFLLLQVVIFAVCVLVSTVFQKIRSILPVSLGIVFMMFIIKMISTSSDDILRFITPFKYFDAAYVYEHGSYESSLFAIAVAIVVVSIGASYVVYIKKDVHAV